MSNNDNLPTLSEAATQEILGDNLAFVIAFGIDGEKKIMFPNGVEINPCTSEYGNPLDLIDITFNLPQTVSSDYPCVSDAYKLLMAAGYCVVGGKRVFCPGTCPPP